MEKTELRKFGLITGTLVVVLFGLVLPWFFEHAYPFWPWLIAGVLWVWALVLPATMEPLYKGWMAVGNLLGWINTRIILGVIFFVIFLPVGFLMKIFGKDPMARSIVKDVKSYRVQSHANDKKNMERPY